MRPYIRKVQYYETDMMGVTHHANYIHWMEEARVDYMEQAGYPYERMEAEGVLSPVRSLSCDYRRPTTFGEQVEVRVQVEALSGARMTVTYEMKNASGETVFTARSEHAFLTREGRLLRVNRDLPEFYAAMTAQTDR